MACFIKSFMRRYVLDHGFEDDPELGFVLIYYRGQLLDCTTSGGSSLAGTMRGLAMAVAPSTPARRPCHQRSWIECGRRLRQRRCLMTSIGRSPTTRAPRRVIRQSCEQSMPKSSSSRRPRSSCFFYHPFQFFPHLYIIFAYLCCVGNFTPLQLLAGRISPGRDEFRGATCLEQRPVST